MTHWLAGNGNRLHVPSACRGRRQTEVAVMDTINATGRRIYYIARRRLKVLQPVYVDVKTDVAEVMDWTINAQADVAEKLSQSKFLQLVCRRGCQRMRFTLAKRM